MSACLWKPRAGPPTVPLTPQPCPCPPLSRREYCADDIAALCTDQAAQLAQAEGYGGDGQVIACLEEQRERISGRRCADEVRRQLTHEAEDVRFDHQLSKACYRCGLRVWLEQRAGKRRSCRTP